MTGRAYDDTEEAFSFPAVRAGHERGVRVRPSFLLPVSVCVIALLSGGCSSDDSSDGGSTTSGVRPPSEVLVTTTIAESTTTSLTSPSTTTTIVASRDEDWVFADAALIAEVASKYCDLWPDVGQLLAEPVVFVDIPHDGWTTGRDLTDGLPAGATRVANVIDDLGTVGAECSDTYVVNGDWIAIPVTMHYDDGSQEEGMWSLQISPSGRVYWHFVFASPIGDETAPSTGETEEAARQFCALFEGIGERNPESILGAMVDDPAIHNIINKNHYVGTDGIATMVPQYLPEELITCGPITSWGIWTANAWALDNDGLGIHLIGVTIQKHDTDRIERQYITVTQLAGATGWGDYLWGADAAGRGDD